mmetsp:Transcript_22636/g.34197  ORF Transcript_22636/g.34197 Transcript_22636/m.34197 type:complete len:716 (+) Transcript_22636:383-2530(+)
MICTDETLPERLCFTNLLESLSSAMNATTLMGECVELRSCAPSLGPKDVYEPLRSTCEYQTLTDAESEVVQALNDQLAVVKTVNNSDWETFLLRFRSSIVIKPCSDTGSVRRYLPAKGAYQFNSFVTSTSLLPEKGKKMRCFGSTSKHTIGAVFMLPSKFDHETVRRTKTWAWPSGYSAKTEFNIDSFGNLINGRQEALVSLETLQQQNNSYLHDSNFCIYGDKIMTGGMRAVPYNEVYVRVGGVGRLVKEVDVRKPTEINGSKRSLEEGIGLPVALFARTWSYFSLVSLLRIRAKICSILGKHNFKGIPLLVITVEEGAQVVTSEMIVHLLKIMAIRLTPFQNPVLAHKTALGQKSKSHRDQKRQELLDLESDNILDHLSLEEGAVIAGGFGATDSSVCILLTNALHEGRIRSVVHEGLMAAARAADYRTARQLLTFYTVVWAKHHSRGDPNFFSDPPPPLAITDILGKTESDGVLIVLGAAQVLKVIQNGSAKDRVNESVAVLNEWIRNKEDSISIWLTQWFDDSQQSKSLKNIDIATETINHRKDFRMQLKRLSSEMDKYGDASFCLLSLHELIISPRTGSYGNAIFFIEMLQYIVGLDARFTPSLLSKAVEFAAACLLEAGNGGENPFALFEYLKRRSLFFRNRANAIVIKSSSPWSNVQLTNHISYTPQTDTECTICHFMSWLIPRHFQRQCNAVVNLPRSISKTLLADF